MASIGEQLRSARESKTISLSDAANDVKISKRYLEALEEGNRQIVSVRFHGMLREDSEQSAPFDETWHLTRPADASRGWTVAGIQQNT